MDIANVDGGNPTNNQTHHPNNSQPVSGPPRLK
ncbi:hypothetical protein PSHT_11872 [Puccinia striiformis]|nr:hypothetical protein PSHT_11872 [Puccinia striiformis]